MRNDDNNFTAHLENCDNLIKLTKNLPATDEEKRNFIRIIEAFRERPDLLDYVKQLEQSIFSLIRAYFGEEGAGRADGEERSKKMETRRSDKK